MMKMEETRTTDQQRTVIVIVIANPKKRAIIIAIRIQNVRKEQETKGEDLSRLKLSPQKKNNRVKI